MPIISPEENLQFLIEAVPGMRERLEEQSMVSSGGPRAGSRQTTNVRRETANGRRQPANGNGQSNGDEQPRDRVDPADIIGQLSQFAETAYATDPLSDEEAQRMNELQQRNERLQPVQMVPYGSVGSQRIGGNPYTIDTRGAAQGLSNFGLSILNNVRQGRREEFEGELSNLQERAQQNDQAREGRTEFFREHFPEFYSDAIEREQEVADREDEQEFESTQNDLDRQHDIELQKLEDQSPGGITTGDMSNLRKMTSDLVERWDSQISDYNSRLSNLDAAITQAREQGRGTYNGQSMSLNDLQEKQQELQRQRDSLQTKRDRRLRRTDRAIQEKAGLDTSIYEDLDVDRPPPSNNNRSEDDMVSDRNREAMPQNPEELRSFLEDVMRGLQQEGSGGDGSGGTTDLSGIYE